MPQLSLPIVFRDHMVLQRDLALPVWGMASPKQRVTVSIAGKTASAISDADGRWRVKLDAMSAGGPHELRVAVDGGESLVCRDVLIGEVWVCSGQSNMEWPLNNSDGAAEEVPAANHPQIRLMSIDRAVSPTAKDDAVGKDWALCTPETAAGFSAVAYYFGRHLHKSLGVPIGLIHSSWGGTLAEAWTDRAVLRADPALEPIDTRFTDALRDYSTVKARYDKEFAEFSEKAFHKDPGNKGFGQGWANPEHDTSTWEKMKLPTYWESAGLPIDGAVWFRRDVQIPASWSGMDLVLSLGAIDDFDESYFNGTRVGGIGKETLNPHAVQRFYTIPADLVKPGRNTIAVRVFDHLGNGGLYGPGSAMKLAPKDNSADPIPLTGDWLYKVELRLEPKSASIAWPAEPLHETHFHSPGGLWHAMIRPLVGYGMRGVIWYQGESNASRGMQYRTLLPAMIKGWRDAWGQGPFAFLIVQLANYGQRPAEPADTDWPELREAQLLTAQQSNNGLAVTIDIGNGADIHPRNKHDVGVRLALVAEAQTYGKKVAYSGPHYDRMTHEAGAIRLHFKHTNGGLSARGGKLKGFAIAGEDKKFYWADATIDGDSIVVRSAEARNPVAVRYAWADDPECNLYNGTGLPASPFRTDDWPLRSAGKV